MAKAEIVPEVTEVTVVEERKVRLDMTVGEAQELLRSLGPISSSSLVYNALSDLLKEIK
jgi:hypothetical protein